MLMDRIDRLLNKAGNISKSEFLSVCYLDKDEADTFVFRPTIWNGRPGECRELEITTHSTRDDALRRFDDLVEQYPGKMPPLLMELAWGNEEIGGVDIWPDV